MSVADLSMIVNDNFKKTLNQQIREMAYNGSYLINETKEFSVDKSGWYKIIVVGVPGGSVATAVYSGSFISKYYVASGGAGGVAIKTTHLSSDETHSIVINGELSSFDDVIAYAGTSAIQVNTGGSFKSFGVGGSAQGGDFNFNGIDGTQTHTTVGTSAGVGVFIPELHRDGSLDTNILGYGASAGISSSGASYTRGTSKQTGIVIIIPLELEE